MPALAFFVALAVLLLVAGCKGRDGKISEKTDPTKRSAEQTEAQADKTDTATAVENDATVDFTGTSEGADQETRNAGGETKNTDGETGTPAETTGRPDVPETDFQQFAEGAALTDGELQSVEDFLNSPGNRNCLVCYYEDPSRISVKEIFYALLPIGEPVSPEEEEALGWTEPYDTAKFTTAKINEFLREKFGISLVEVTREVGLPYLPEQDAYYVDVSDTNLVVAECISGMRTDGAVRVVYKQRGVEWEVTLQESDGGYQFVSNVNLSAQENRDYVEHVMEIRNSLEVTENESYLFYYRPDQKELIFAVDQEPRNESGKRTYYFKGGECVVITDERVDDWIAVRGAYAPSNGRYIRETESVDQEYGAEVLRQFRQIFPHKLFR